MGYDLKFIHLGITIEHLHNHISVFGFAIAFYGIIIATGMLLGSCPIWDCLWRDWGKNLLCYFFMG